jgi:hypothetical protein
MLVIEVKRPATVPPTSFNTPDNRPLLGVSFVVKLSSALARDWGVKTPLARQRQILRKVSFLEGKDSRVNQRDRCES